MRERLKSLLQADSASQVIRFGVVGATGVVVNNLVLYLLHGVVGWSLIPASVMAVELAILNNFIWNDRWTFSSRDGARYRFLRFNLVSLGGLLINTGVLAALVAATGMHYLVANLVAIAAAMGWNFSANARWTWIRPKGPVAEPPRLVGSGTMTGEDLVVIPTYNEAPNIEALVGDILTLGPFSVLVVDDGSPDGTGQIADRLARGNPGRVSVLHRQGKDGLGSAYRAGFAHAIGIAATRTYQMDADFSHDPSVLPALRSALLSGHDLVIGSRYVPGGRVRGWPWWRLLLSRGGSVYAGLLLGLPQKDLTGGFKGWRTEALEAVRPEATQSNGYAFQVETTYRAGLAGARIAELPITFADREQGASKMGLPIVFEAIGIVPWLRWNRPEVDRIRTRTRTGRSV